MDLTRSPPTLLLPIDAGQWAPPARGIRLDGIDFAPKPELHVTLIGSRLGRELHAVLGPAFLRRQLGRALAAHDWRFTRSGRLLLLTQQTGNGGGTATGATRRSAVIELIDLPAMRPFHEALGRLLGRQLPVPPPHVTLYTAGDPRGIGLARRSRLRAITVRELPLAAISRPA